MTQWSSPILPMGLQQWLKGDLQRPATCGDGSWQHFLGWHGATRKEGGEKFGEDFFCFFLMEVVGDKLLFLNIFF